MMHSWLRTAKLTTEVPVQQAGAPRGRIQVPLQGLQLLPGGTAVGRSQNMSARADRAPQPPDLPTQPREGTEG